MGSVANWLMTASLFLLVFWWRLSAALFAIAWLIFGLAYVLDGFAHGRDVQPERSRQALLP